MTAATVEIRCPIGPRRLFAKVVAEGQRPKIVEFNLIEIACQDCRRLRRLAGEECSRVLHRFNLLGDCVETEVVP